MQLPGQIVERDRTVDEYGVAVAGVIGVISEVGTATLHQPDRVTRDLSSGAEVSRVALPDLEVQTVTVKWEDGSESTLTECIDQWVTLGAIEELPQVKSDGTVPPGAMGELPEQRAHLEDVLGRVSEYAAELRAAEPLAAARAEAERVVVVEDDGVLTVAQ